MNIAVHRHHRRNPSLHYHSHQRHYSHTQVVHRRHIEMFEHAPARWCRVTIVFVAILAQVEPLQKLKMAAVVAPLRFIVSVACPVYAALSARRSYTACAEIVFVSLSWLNVGALIFHMMLYIMKQAPAWTISAQYIRTSVIRSAT